MNNYLRIFNSSFLLQTVAIKKNSIKNKWITKGIKTSCNTKRKLYLAYRQKASEEIKLHYRLYSRILANVIREGKKKTMIKKILESNNKSKTTWGIINETSGHQQPKSNVHGIKTDHKHITDTKEIAEVFNDFFTFKETKANKYNILNRLKNTTTNNCYSNLNDIQHSPSLVFNTFLTKEISSIIKSIKAKDTHGYDGIPTKILKISSNYITSPLTYICNEIFLSGSFPDRLKFSVVKPVHKKGDKTNYTNYRPISLLISYSKVFEKAIYTRLTEYLINNNLLVENQYGFQKGLSTDNASFKLIK